MPWLVPVLVVTFPLGAALTWWALLGTTRSSLLGKEQHGEAHVRKNGGHGIVDVCSAIAHVSDAILSSTG